MGRTKIAAGRRESKGKRGGGGRQGHSMKKEKKKGGWGDKKTGRLKLKTITLTNTNIIS